MKNNWTLKVFFLTFILAVIFSLITNLLGKYNSVILIICILSIIIIGIIFDMIGIAALSCNPKVLHSKASQKLKGAKKAIWLSKNASTVSSFCNDVIGDICGIISGSLVTVLVINLFSEHISLGNVLLSSILSALTVGGKALGKAIGVNKSNIIVYNVGKFLTLFSNKK